MNQNIKCFELNKENIKSYTEHFKMENRPFEMHLSNYTVKLVNDKRTVHFMANAQSKATFAGAMKVKKDILKKDIPVVNYESIKYYDYNLEIANDKILNLDSVLNFDLKSAYATILKNYDFISDETFLHVSKMKKQERLAAIGMLASKKYIFYFDQKGNLQENFEKKESEFKNFFYFAVQKTNETMINLVNKFKDEFIFYWVDGIYYKSMDYIYNEIEKIMKENNFLFSHEILSNFKVENFKNHIYLEFDKPKKDGTFENKYFNFPKENSKFAKEFLTKFKLY
jgi:hypothetical protein